MRAHRWGFLLAAFVVASSCSTSSPPEAAAPRAPGTTSPLGTIAGTDPARDPGTTVPVGEQAIVADFQATDAVDGCALTSIAADFSDFPAARLAGADGAAPAPTLAANERFPGAPRVTMPVDADALPHGPDMGTAVNPDPTAAWFAIEDVAIARVDGDAVAVTSVLVVGEGCHVWDAVGDAERVVAKVCARPPDVQTDPIPCSIVMASSEGETIGRWSASSIEAARVGFDGDQIIWTGGPGAEPVVVRIDAATGRGSALRAIPGCARPIGGEVVDGTPFVQVGCRAPGADGSVTEAVVDTTSGNVVRRFAEADHPDLVTGYNRTVENVETLSRFGEEISAFGYPRFDAATFAELGPGWLSSAAVATIGDAADEPITIVAMPDGAWVQRCSGPCASETGEVAFLDPNGTAIDRWPQAFDLYSSRGNVAFNQRSRMLAVDPRGVWMHGGAGELIRLERNR